MNDLTQDQVARLLKDKERLLVAIMVAAAHLEIEVPDVQQALVILNKALLKS